ncbi:glucosamine-6-phosphate deaminase [Parapedobacter lycopersici]|uniref:glucosamine-6-phosphate deaminase n=1 Tax=Parapedobacter lycopersici TaxID=1864939 RepID=UPI00214D149C|nr:glucosamine-6-phosphate deaminase [Parapedobacter lycopersici]
MNVIISADAKALGDKAGRLAATYIKKAIAERGEAFIIVATGTSQFETLNTLLQDGEIDWSAVTLFHLDEYIDLPVHHPASFRKYLIERVLARTGPLKAAYLIDGESDPVSVIDALADRISGITVDVALVGIGENGHLAFNDPPADFETEAPYLVVDLDEPCRAQQCNEGWFADISEVPRQAISMSVKQILKSTHIICSVPDRRKAQAVKDSLEQPVSNRYPASILQTHPSCYFFLDEESASLLQTPAGGIADQ